MKRRQVSKKARLMDSLVEGWAHLVRSLVLARRDSQKTRQQVADSLGISISELAAIERLEISPSMELLVNYAYEMNLTFEVNVRAFDFDVQGVMRNRTTGHTSTAGKDREPQYSFVKPHTSVRKPEKIEA